MTSTVSPAAAAKRSETAKAFRSDQVPQKRAATLQAASAPAKKISHPPPQPDTDEYDKLLDDDDDMDLDDLHDFSTSTPSTKKAGQAQGEMGQVQNARQPLRVVPAASTSRNINSSPQRPVVASSPQIHAGPGLQIGRSYKAPNSKGKGPPATQADTAEQQKEYPWSRDVRKALRMRFKLEDFRPNQLEAINATLEGRDVFVLMPTGGGKSICYQLPAVVTTGATKGVTVVVSPLLSLIVDQVSALADKDIAVLTLNSTTPADDRRFAVDMLRSPVPQCSLVYVTPEMINNSGQFKDILRGLHQRKQLARFVVDEAHCVSQWGHDLRRLF